MTHALNRCGEDAKCQSALLGLLYVQKRHARGTGVCNGCCKMLYKQHLESLMHHFQINQAPGCDHHKQMRPWRRLMEGQFTG